MHALVQDQCRVACRNLLLEVSMVIAVKHDGIRFSARHACGLTDVSHSVKERQRTQRSPVEGTRSPSGAEAAACPQSSSSVRPRGTDFDPAKSGANFLAQRESSRGPGIADRIFGLPGGLAAAAGREADLLSGSPGNRCLPARINECRVAVHEARLQRLLGKRRTGDRSNQGPHLENRPRKTSCRTF